MAPELHNPEIFDLKELRRTAASDVYALACVALEVGDGFTHLCFSMLTERLRLSDLYWKLSICGHTS
jgi:hypothetical protein